MFGLFPVPRSVSFDSDGVRLRWRALSNEGSYIGRFVPWSDVVDGDARATPPQVRISSGAVLFLGADHATALSAALARAGKPEVRRGDPWALLLEPFLDTDYEFMRIRTERTLSEWGFLPDEVRRIRRRVGPRATIDTMWTLEWVFLGQLDYITAWNLLRVPPGIVPAWWYRRMRRRADRIALRGPVLGSRLPSGETAQ